MADWLGKNELGQTDKKAVEHSGGLTVRLNVTAYKEEVPKSAEDKTVIAVTEVQQANLPTISQANRLLEGRVEDGPRGRPLA